MGLNRRIEQRNVALDRSRHRLAVPLPALGTPFDIGEEEGDGAKGKLDHRPYPKAFSARGQSRIVACDGSEGGSTTETDWASAVAVWDAEESTRSQQSRTPTRWALARFPHRRWLHHPHSKLPPSASAAGVNVHPSCHLQHPYVEQEIRLSCALCTVALG